MSQISISHLHAKPLTSYDLSVISFNVYLECRNMDELNLFISESVIMKNFKHTNVLGLVGVSVGVTDDVTAPYIILPYMVNGDLKGYLQSKRSEAEDNREPLFKVFVHG